MRTGRVEDVYYELRWFDRMGTAELVAEFNPHDEDAVQAASLTARGFMVLDVLRGWVERVDVCWDSERDPYMVVLDYPRCVASVKNYGLTSRGFQTCAVGYIRGDKRKLRRYDKRAELASCGVEVSAPWCRVEAEALAPFVSAAADRSKGPPPAADVMLKDLATIECPLRGNGGVVELVRDPGGYADERFLALGCVAMQMGPKVVRSCARAMLGASEVKRAEFVLWTDRSEELRSAFDRQWASEVGRVVGLMGSPYRRLAESSG